MDAKEFVLLSLSLSCKKTEQKGLGGGRPLSPRL